MRKHGGTPSCHLLLVTLAATSPPAVARGHLVGGHQSGLAGCKSPPLFTRAAPSCRSQGQRQGETWGASPRPRAPTYIPSYLRTYLSWCVKMSSNNRTSMFYSYRQRTQQGQLRLPQLMLPPL